MKNWVGKMLKRHLEETYTNATKENAYLQRTPLKVMNRSRRHNGLEHRKRKVVAKGDGVTNPYSANKRQKVKR